jgi:mevalonate kinase
MKIYPNLFYAKIMLFGEYSVIFDSMALTIPYSHFNGELAFIRKDNYTNQAFATKSNQDLKAYSKYIRDLYDKKELLCEFNTKKFTFDVERGLYFESTIPQGYGLGSSGALCAALYTKYVSNKITGRNSLSKEKIIELKNIFSQLESFFHGTSSGLDPLNAYLKYSVLIKNKKDIEIVRLPVPNLNGLGAIFLIDTGAPGNTQPLVNLFLDKYKQPMFKKLVHNELIKYNNDCVNGIVEGSMAKLFDNLEKLSAFQLERMNQMIPYKFQNLWKQGINNKKYFLKLCGSGGGGFIMGFTKNYNNVREIMLEQDIDIIPVFIS